jgi:D-alanyl-D-alanine-carboxypeptidase/D-alanyl-D-alanine-endopeptidase
MTRSSPIAAALIALVSACGGPPAAPARATPAVLARNAADHPQSSNAHDSLGEIYALAGDRDRAIASYERSVALDPGNAHGVDALARLRATQP